MTNKKTTPAQEIAEYRAQVKELTADAQVFLTLANNSFKGVSQNLIPLLLLEGQMRGLTIKDFMTKRAYAIPYGNTATIVQSVDHCRTIAAQAGQSGKSEPTYALEVIGEDKDGKEIKDLSCSITVYKVGGDERGYTAKIYLSEYYAGHKNTDGSIKSTKFGPMKPGLWDTKPRTMLAKVAEMHALRSAFPEKLQNAYVEEEMQRGVIDITEPQQEQDAATLEQIALVTENMDACTDLETLQNIYKDLDKKVRLDKNIVQSYDTNKSRLQNKVGTRAA